MSGYMYGITLGPIVSSLHYATSRGSNKTRSLYFGSLMFSEWMGEIIRTVQQNHSVTWYLPAPEVEQHKGAGEHLDAGLFPDRAFFHSDSNVALLRNTLDELQRTFEQTHNIGESYLKYDLVCMEYAGALGSQISCLQKLLDNKELARIPQGGYQRHALELMIKRETLARSRAIRSIPTTLEIAEFGKSKFQRLHKHSQYIAFIQADGDNFGDFLKQLDTREKLLRFSSALLDYSKKVALQIQAYGGICFYAGGDDLLAVVPLFNGERHFVQLIEDLNDTLGQTLSQAFPEPEYQSIVGTLHLSVGVAVGYYKHPMSEMLKRVYDKLQCAKRTTVKNATAIHVEKHSGAGVSFVASRETAHKNSGVYDAMIKLLGLAFSLANGSSEASVLFSIRYKLMEHRVLLNNVLDVNHDRCRPMLTAYFSQQFNESVHRKYDHFFKNVVDLMVTMREGRQVADVLEQVCALLYICKFITEFRSDEEG